MQHPLLRKFGRRGISLQSQIQKLAKRLDAQERWVVARARCGYARDQERVNEALRCPIERSKEAIDELLAPHMGMAIAMMTAGMRGQTAR